ncbi:molybdenum cofactor guanylyltransferase MobA [Vibrio sp. SS-MA-C1-2]|uniref:molybdenum cofactor guanylyltransferase MobA n=1 Tax=Vibrio sp. SS-MA-C1-2 TaxID=2908646 RepID=UPI001F4504FC|nr:molybdenum cofactor guanylyltransferase MobA [Vibrio sp. SS-MA-C1-2]UJF18156.1 molybdenum cofactor guanylyltransferase MobA [Vibrio sp. SS-MA-C1-2]
MPTAEQTSWVILAGGQATRMGGNDKGLVKLNGQPFIQHVINSLSPQTDNIFINANRNIEQYRQYATVFHDQFEGYPGPLGGIHAALQKIDTDWVGFVPCDCPNLPVDLVSRMVNACHEETDIAVAHDGQYIQPVVTLFHRRVFSKLDAFLQRGDRKIILLYKDCNTVEVDFSDQPNAFINLNSMDDISKYGNLS